MKHEFILQQKIAKPDLLVITGSRLYGTARYDEKGNCLSDKDLRGVVMPPWEYQTYLNFEQGKIPNEADGLIYSFGFFVKQLLASNPQHLELLFVNPENVLECNDLGRELFKIRDAFVCKRFYKRIFGFGNSEWRKARGVEFEKNKRTKTEDDVINDIRNIFGPNWGNDQKEIMEGVLSLLFSKHDRKEVSSMDKISGKRITEFEKYGYGVSSACHAIRLARQCTELLKTGTMTFPRPDAVELSDIKHGRISLDNATRIYEDAMKEAEEASILTTLPETSDVARINKWYREVLKRYLTESISFTDSGYSGVSGYSPSEGFSGTPGYQGFKLVTD